ncbi:hypothetical protein CTA2_4277 [Colletotrichum tanaceti]|uniref:Uncharacterized protein n=1 Tax=Colletotrichum tanaceti TaxID=1306861 RepID=A0A4U6X819_9PEZI|nr:hypothetical protein CTA2_4277 [Colletotrichum tanaceti]TKW51660.1 hypothetical protein CTA1_12601 [Colletotrichum tanaceti]
MEDDSMVVDSPASPAQTEQVMQTAEPPIPPIPKAILCRDPLPELDYQETKDSGRPKKLHKASKSAHCVYLPQHMIAAEPTRWTEQSDEFILTNSFPGLQRKTLLHDPSLNFLHNEADVARAVEAFVHRPMALTLVHGHKQGTFKMQSHSQPYYTVAWGADRLPKEPESIELMPDMITTMEIQLPDGTTKQVAVMMEYKDTLLNPIEQFKNAIGLAKLEKTARMVLDTLDEQADMLVRGSIMDEASSIASESEQLLIGPSDSTVYAPAFEELDDDLDEQSNDAFSTLGLDLLTGYQMDAKEIVTQLTAYALAVQTPWGIVTDFVTATIFHFHQMERQVSAKEQLRKGPGEEVTVLNIQDSREILPNLLGLMLEAERTPW